MAVTDRAAWLATLLMLACTPDGGVQFEPSPAVMPEVTTGETGSVEDAGGLPPPATTLPPDPGSESGGGGGGGSEETGSGGEAPVTGTLVPAQAKQWRHLASSDPPPADWAALEFDDKAWPEGQAPYGDGGEVLTVIDPAAAPVGLYLRRRFTATPGAGHLMLYMRRGDGAAVYLNGVEVARSNLPAGALGPATLAEDDLGGDEVRRYLRFVIPGDALRAGDNVIAVALRRAGVGEPGLALDLRLDTFDLAATSEELSVQWRTRSYGGEYASDNVGVAWIETAGGAFVRTLTLWAEVRREHLVRWQQSAQGDVVDAVTSATRGGHRTSEAVWDLRDALGQPAAPGAYKLMLEFTEADSNKGDAPGPRIELPFTLGEGPSLPVAPAHPQYRDLLVVAP